ncbi:hypothetical protein P692DRAFT_20876439 [Suillus brevipes Sb2]|nr:hypothetical protein P692DRAFT_20876439 [Suillus brevipes Sb2]
MRSTADPIVPPRLPLSSLNNCTAEIIPTSSASYTVCTWSLPRLNLLRRLGIVAELLGIGSSDPLYGYIIPVDTAVRKPKDAEGRPSITHHFYVGPRPAQNQCSFVEQRTRGLHVWDVAQKRVVFFKEPWRRDSPGISTESVVYTRNFTLAAFPTSRPSSTAVTCLPSGQKQSLTHSARPGGAAPPTTGHTSLSYNIESSFVMLNDALTAHQEAYQYHGLLHRNISMENIGVTSEGRGFLMGWKCCSLKSHDELLEIQMGSRIGQPRSVNDL